MPFTAGADEEVPVLIVGGGGAGLTSSMLLARLGVEHLLVSARPQTSDLPKAHVLNQRAMEVLDDVGVAVAAICSGGVPRRAIAPATPTSSSTSIARWFRTWALGRSEVCGRALTSRCSTPSRAGADRQRGRVSA